MATWAIRMLLTPLLVVPASTPKRAISAFIAHKMNRLLIIICEDLLPDLAWIRPIITAWAELNRRAKEFDWKNGDRDSRSRLISDIVHLVRSMARAPHGHLFSMLRLVSGAGHATADREAAALNLAPVRHLFDLPVWDSARVPSLGLWLRSAVRMKLDGVRPGLIKLLEFHDAWYKIPRSGAMHSKIYLDQFRELWSCLSRVALGASEALSSACSTIKNRDQPLFIYMGAALLVFKNIRFAPPPDPPTLDLINPVAQQQVRIETELLDKHTPRGTQREICKLAAFSQFSFQTSVCNVPESLAELDAFRSLQRMFQMAGLMKDAVSPTTKMISGFHPRLISILAELVPGVVAEDVFGPDWVKPRLNRLRDELELLAPETPVAKIRSRVLDPKKPDPAKAGSSPPPPKRRVGVEI